MILVMPLNLEYCRQIFHRQMPYCHVLWDDLKWDHHLTVGIIFLVKTQWEANSLFEISGFYSGDRTSKGNGSYSKLTLLFQRNIIERWKQKRTSTLWVCCNPHSFYSHVTSSIACEMALCLGKGWKTRDERKRKGESP